MMNNGFPDKVVTSRFPFPVFQNLHHRVPECIAPSLVQVSARGHFDVAQVTTFYLTNPRFSTPYCSLLELVEDCGPLPLANDKCKLDTEKTNKTAPFPACCPTFTCEPGAKLEYPEIKTAPESTSEQSAKN